MYCGIGFAFFRQTIWKDLSPGTGHRNATQAAQPANRRELRPFGSAMQVPRLCGEMQFTPTGRICALCYLDALPEKSSRYLFVRLVAAPRRLPGSAPI